MGFNPILGNNCRGWDRDGSHTGGSDCARTQNWVVQKRVCLQLYVYCIQCMVSDEQNAIFNNNVLAWTRVHQSRVQTEENMALEIVIKGGQRARL